MAGREPSVESREQRWLVPSSNCTVPLASSYDDDVFPNFLWWISLKYIGLTVTIINHYDGTTCQFLVSINCRHIHILFNFPDRKSRKIIFVFSTSPGHVICFPHLHLLKTARSERAPPVRSICSSWPSHSRGSQMEWTILDCGRVFPLHGEVMENSHWGTSNGYWCNGIKGRMSRTVYFEFLLKRILNTWPNVTVCHIIIGLSTP